VLALEEKYEKDVEFIIADTNSQEGRRLGGEFDIYYIPAIFILGGDGEVRYSEEGVRPLSELDAELSEVTGGK